MTKLSERIRPDSPVWLVEAVERLEAELAGATRPKTELPKPDMLQEDGPHHYKGDVYVTKWWNEESMRAALARGGASEVVVLPAGWVAIPLDPTEGQWTVAQGTLLDTGWDAITCLAARVQALIAATRAQWERDAPEAAKDPERLEFMLKHSAFVVQQRAARRGDNREPMGYQCWEQDTDENYITLSGMGIYHPTKRAAIDAAIGLENKHARK